MPALCFACEHLTLQVERTTGIQTASRCAAYPDRIPMQILDGAGHSVPRGDEVDGLIFSQAGSEEAREAFHWWQKTFVS